MVDQGPAIWRKMNAIKATPWSPPHLIFPSSQPKNLWIIQHPQKTAKISDDTNDWKLS